MAARINPKSFRNDEEEDAGTPPWRSRSRREEKESDAPPKTRKRTVSESDVEGDEEEDAVIPMVSGADSIRNMTPSDSGLSTGIYFRWPEEGTSTVVKFLDIEPTAYMQHWVTRSGRQSFPCIGKDCPLCEIGSKATQKVAYLLLNVSMETPMVQMLEVSRTLFTTLDGYDADRKTGPLPKLFWALSRTKSGQTSGFTKYNYSFIPIKERDLDEDWDIDFRIVEDAVENAEIPDINKLIGEGISRSFLRDIAEEALG